MFSTILTVHNPSLINYSHTFSLSVLSRIGSHANSWSCWCWLSTLRWELCSSRCLHSDWTPVARPVISSSSSAWHSASRHEVKTIQQQQLYRIMASPTELWCSRADGVCWVTGIWRVMVMVEEEEEMVLRIRIYVLTLLFCTTTCVELDSLRELRFWEPELCRI